MFYTLLEIAGSLGLFLYGMKVMNDGIQKAAGERLHKIMNYMTGNRFAAVLTGLAITSIIQSSSATTVMVVSFVNAGLLSLAQSIGVIMGANIGTTITGWVVSILGFKFKIATIALPTIGVGFPLLFSKKLKKRHWGETLIGFGILFLGLNFLKNSVPDINSNPQALEFLSHYTKLGFASTLIFIAAGSLLTIIVQSSSAAMAITLTMAYSGWIDFPTAAAIVLGENIGTTITAFLASLTAHVNARRTARAHTLFNIIGVMWMLIIFRPFLTLVDVIVPGNMASQEAITHHLAMFHTMFNVVNTLVLIGFIAQLEKLVTTLVKPKEEEKMERYELTYFSTPIQDVAEINILEARKEVSKMAGIIEEMFSQFLTVFHNPGKDLHDEVQQLGKMEDYTDQMQEQISQFLVECTHEELNETSARNVNSMIRIVHELERIADDCYTLILLCQRRYHKKITFHEKAVEDIEPYATLVQEFVRFNKAHLNEYLSEDELTRAYTMETQIDEYRKKLKKAAQTRLQEGSEVKGELLYIDMLSHIERIGDYCLNISQALRYIH